MTEIPKLQFTFDSLRPDPWLDIFFEMQDVCSRSRKTKKLFLKQCLSQNFTIKLSFKIIREIMLVLSCAIAQILLTHNKILELLIQSVHSTRMQKESSDSQLLISEQNGLIADFLVLILSSLTQQVGRREFVFLTSSKMILMLITQRDLLETYWIKVTNGLYQNFSPDVNKNQFGKLNFQIERSFFLKQGRQNKF